LTRYIRTHVVECEDDMAGLLGIQHWPGYLSPFTRDQAPLAMKNGTRVVKKMVDDSNDLAKVGTLGTVLGSIANPMSMGLAYFVEWDTHPRLPSLVVAAKIMPAKK
jgi:hypothetical protein